ncbi:MAG: kynureninase [Rhodoferax sp.]|nr:kynureninase [Rhodoferax sp.]
MTTAPTLEDCRQRDAQDPLRSLRDLFDIPPELIYLDGNSLGVLPRATAARVAQTVTEEWGRGLIRSWNDAGWFDLPQVLGDRIASLVGAGAGELVVTDSTSVNLYKVLSAAFSIAKNADPVRRRIVSERNNFPTDLYVAQALCEERGFTLDLVESEDLAAALAPQAARDLAVLMLTHVNYRTGEMHDMAALSAAAHRAGALTVWDLSHSAGAVTLALGQDGADFAVGCGYKYLNGGPGAPAFVWVHPRHAERFWQPLAGWWGHAAPFAFTPDYRPAPGISRYLCGTQPILSLRALACGLDTFAAAQPLGGMAALRQKSLALGDLFIELVDARCAGHGLSLVTPREAGRRGSQICLTRPEGAYAIVQALIARGVIGDFRAGDGARHPDILRFGLTPLYVGHADVWRAVDHLRQVLEGEEWRRPEFNRQKAVT